MGKLLDAGFARVGVTEIREAAAPRAKTSKSTIIADASVAKKKRRGDKAVEPAMTVVAAPGEEKQAGKRDAEHGWAIQVGAFNRADAARKAAESAAKLTASVVANAGIEISPQGKRHSMHRARLIGLTGAQAREACQILTRKDRDCMMLSPSGSYVRVAASNAESASAQ